MLKSSAEASALRRHGMKFIIVTNLVALFYGLSSEFGLAYILTAYLIESILIGLFASLVLIRKTLHTGRTLAGLSALTIFTLPFFGSIALMAAFPMLLMDAMPLDRFETVANTYEALTEAAGGMTLSLFFGYFFAMIGQYLFEVLRFITVYHWPVLIGMTAIYGYEFLKEQPSSEMLATNPFSSFIIKPFWRMVFLIYGPYYIGFVFFIGENGENLGPLSWELNAVWVIVLTFAKFCLDSWRFQRRIRRLEPPVMNVQQPLRYGAMERNDRRAEFKLEDTFTY